MRLIIFALASVQSGIVGFTATGLYHGGVSIEQAVINSFIAIGLSILSVPFLLDILIKKNDELQALKNRVKKIEDNQGKLIVTGKDVMIDPSVSLP